MHALVADVAAHGGAVGWLHVPEPAEVRTWLDGVLAADVRLVLARDGGAVVGLRLLAAPRRARCCGRTPRSARS